MAFPATCQSLRHTLPVSRGEADHRFDSAAPVSRRAVLGGLGLLPLTAAIRGNLPTASADSPYFYLSTHQAAVLDAATRRLVPGPEDDLFELGHPGAHEANVVRFLDYMLSAFSFSPPQVHAGGPWSNRAGGSQDFIANFVPLTRAQTYAWNQRIANYRQQYTSGIALLDQLAGGDFTKAPRAQQDFILAQGQAVPFTALLFGHTIEAMYAVPEYGGNAGLVGWRDIYFPGDVQPRGYTNAEVEAVQFDPVGIPPNGVIARLLNGGWAQAIAEMGGKAGVNAGH